jgi:hypothetical protein
MPRDEQQATEFSKTLAPMLKPASFFQSAQSR